MISIIICSRYKNISSQLNDNIFNSIGIEYELITIDNSANSLSIFQAYNKGISIAKYDFLCFIHEDILFYTQNWGQNIIKHLSNPKIGVVGVAGGPYVSTIPGQWSDPVTIKNIIQFNKKRKTSLHLTEPNDNFEPLEAMVVDGVFMAFRNSIFKEISFDENLGGFHGYDYDICLQAVNKGYVNIVVFDILIEHFSEGNKNKDYYKNIIEIYAKWTNLLPIQTENFRISRKNITKIDKGRANKLIRRMVKNDFEINEIIQTFTKFSPNNKVIKSYSKFEIYSKIYFAKLIKLLK